MSGVCGPVGARDSDLDDKQPCEVCGRSNILDGDDPGIVYDDAHPQGVWVCSEKCTVEAVAQMRREDPEEHASTCPWRNEYVAVADDLPCTCPVGQP